MQQSAGKEASSCGGTPPYKRHRPERTLLYQLIQDYYPVFEAHCAEQGKPLPAYVCQDFTDYLKCGRLEHGFLRVLCESCHAEHRVAFSCKRRGFCPSCGARRMAESAALLVDEVLPHQPIRQWVLSVPIPLRFLLASRPDILAKVLGIVYRTLATHLIHQAGYIKATARTGAVTLIQRFGSALNLNIHFHMLFLDGVYVDAANGSTRFQWVKAPTRETVIQLTHTLAERIGRFDARHPWRTPFGRTLCVQIRSWRICLERQGLLDRDEESCYLSEDALDEDPMNPLLGHSVTYRIAVGPHTGRKVFTLQTLPPSDEPGTDQVAGFSFSTSLCFTPSGQPMAVQNGHPADLSLHAGVAARANERNKLERLCRYITRPALSEKRLSLTDTGLVRYELKTPYRDGTTHVFFEPLDFIAKLAALVPRPRVNLTRFHGVFAPNSKHRVQVTPAKRGKGKQPITPDETPDQITKSHTAMSWAQRLKRVFGMPQGTLS